MLRIKERTVVWGLGTLIESPIDSPACDVRSVSDVREMRQSSAASTRENEKKQGHAYENSQCYSCWDLVAT